MTWLDELTTAPLLEVAEALGLEPRGAGSLAPCPACGEARRGSQDGRGPVGLRGDRRGWRCHRCGLTGDVVTLAALVLTGEPKPAGADGWARVREWAEGRGWCRRGDAPPLPRREPVPAAPPRRPPADEVAATWASCVGVTEDAEVAGWLRGRALDPAAVEDLDMARALPVRARLPRWARGPRGAWTESGHRLVLPLFGATGRLEALRARAVVPLDGGPKGLAPAGAEVRGLVLACPLARLLLAGAALGDGSPAAELVRTAGLVVTEGEPDWLTWSTRWGVDGELERAPAVVGLVAGSWTEDLAARVPEGTCVGLRVHHDAAGEGYAARVAATLGARCEVRRALEETAA